MFMRSGSSGCEPDICSSSSRNLCSTAGHVSTWYKVHERPTKSAQSDDSAPGSGAVYIFH